MATNKYTATRKIDDKAIQVTVERGTWDEKKYLDGYYTGTETHIVNKMTICLIDANGNVVVSGNEIKPMSYAKVHYPRQYDEAVNAGCVGMLGRAFLRSEVHGLIVDAIAEADANTPKTTEQIEIETAEAERAAKMDAWRNSPEGKAGAEAQERHERLMREMDDPNSDL